MDAEPAAASASWLPLTVTVRAVLQSVAVKLSVCASTVASPLAVSVTVTPSVGCEVSSTSYVPVPPSRTVSSVGLTLIPRSSSSVMVPVAVASCRVACSSVPASRGALRVTVKVSSPSASASPRSDTSMVAPVCPAAKLSVPSATAV